jgi:hypothetical protein
VVTAIKGNDPNWWRYGQLVADIQVILSTRRSWQIRDIRRAAIYATHGLAKVTVKQIMDNVWIEKILESICDIVILEHSILAL